jgi:hypothetical protein
MEARNERQKGMTRASSNPESVAPGYVEIVDLRIEDVIASFTAEVCRWYMIDAKRVSKKMRLVDTGEAIMNNSAYTKGTSTTNPGSAVYT